MTLSNLWQNCLLQLQDQVSASDLSTWLRPLQADVVSDNHIVLYASNMFVKGWVENPLSRTNPANLSNTCTKS
ncbi:chromosomal replication initiator protein DnaA, DNA-binding transcriptional dual regulator [Haemophilus influenzae]|uniref:Chromosomal replication initiator protein DnaA, DNA-binding transcriptional dual regulator n=1 Tax=Haemophilus influenzae TaxID=727 RepID=A0A2X1PZG4_HAEIF|nr:chromosomal replication initiator protein DnaA, DNA-binding transcriptional dual regulator [Haemophilus influenzae]